MKRFFLLALLGILLVGKALAQNVRIRAEEAAKHIGEYKEVSGPEYGMEYRENKAVPDSAFELCYLSGYKRPNAEFIIIMEIKSLKGDSVKIKDYQRRSILQKKELEAQIKKGVVFGGLAAYGKIFLFEGKPAIRIKAEDIGILETID